MINKKLIFSDFDGTLANSAHQVSQKNVDAIKKYENDGGIFVICTGRMPNSILPRAKQIGLTGTLVAYQGTAILNIAEQKYLYLGGFSVEQTVYICQTLERLDIRFNVYSGETLYTNVDEDNKNLKWYQEVTAVTAVRPSQKLSQFVQENGLICQKVACLVAPEQKLSIYHTLKQALGDGFDIAYSAEVLVEISPLGNNKGAALEKVCSLYQIPLSQTVAIGDNLNDLSMILKASVGVAVGNAVQELKDQADVVTVSNDEDAIAKIIEEYGY